MHYAVAACVYANYNENSYKLCSTDKIFFVMMCFHARTHSHMQSTRDRQIEREWNKDTKICFSIHTLHSRRFSFINNNWVRKWKEQKKWMRHKYTILERFSCTYTLSWLSLKNETKKKHTHTHREYKQILQQYVRLFRR